MTRPRPSIEGGYRRKTVTLPADLVRRLEEHLAKAELTFSAFLTRAAEAYLERRGS